MTDLPFSGATSPLVSVSASAARASAADVPDAPPGQVQAIPDLLQGLRPCPIDSISQAQDMCIAIAQSA